MHIFRTTAFQTTIASVFGMMLLCSSPGWAAPAPKEVTVVNDPSNPVLIEDVDNPARQPFQRFVEITNAFDPQGFGGTIATVPNDSRLVIEFLSAGCTPAGVGGVEPTKIRVFASITHFFSIQNQVFGIGFSSTATHVTRMYAEPGSDVRVTVFPTTNLPTIICQISISGYLIEP